MHLSQHRTTQNIRLEASFTDVLFHNINSIFYTRYTFFGFLGMVDHLLWCFLFLLGIFTLIFDDTDCASPHPRANLLPESLPRIACLHRTMKIHEIEIARCKEDVMCLKPWKTTHVKFRYFCACCELWWGM